MTKSRGINRPKHAWDEFQEQLLAKVYPHFPTQRIAEAWGLHEQQIYHKAHAMGLTKSEAFLASERSGRLMRESAKGCATRFKRGMTPWNKGLQIGSHPGSVATQFKKGTLNGTAAQRLQPIGAYRINCDGYLDKKIAGEDVPPHKRWVAVHRLVWEAENGPIPHGHVVVFKQGCRTTELSEITANRLELITRQQLMARNTIHNLPDELRQVIQLKGALVRRIHTMEKHHAK